MFASYTYSLTSYITRLNSEPGTATYATRRKSEDDCDTPPPLSRSTTTYGCHINRTAFLERPSTITSTSESCPIASPPAPSVSMVPESSNVHPPPSRSRHHGTAAAVAAPSSTDMREQLSERERDLLTSQHSRRSIGSHILMGLHICARCMVGGYSSPEYRNSSLPSRQGSTSTPPYGLGAAGVTRDRSEGRRGRESESEDQRRDSIYRRGDRLRPQHSRTAAVGGLTSEEQKKVLQKRYLRTSAFVETGGYLSLSPPSLTEDPCRDLEEAYVTTHPISLRMKPVTNSSHTGREDAAKEDANTHINGTSCPLTYPIASSTCTVCLSFFNDGEEVAELPCGHIYHFGCITQWMERHYTCPYCRADLH